MNNIDDLRDRYDELENVVNTLQRDSLRVDAEREMEELGRERQKMEDIENKEQEFEYARSRF